MFPGDFPVFLRANRLHDELIARELEGARQVFADQRPHQCAFNMEGEGVSALIDFVHTKSGFIAALRVLLRSRRSLWRRVALHDLNRRVAVAREDNIPVESAL